MDIAKVEERIKELVQAVEQSAGQHNALVGRLAESQEMLKKMREFEETLKKGE